ncbi:hypothetical protein AB1K70_21420 [Bremerella sp. JC770]|uniref:hypothetical protein n=1 Tax=Bremerella sp. JC770 TaxID=3232137 RepID=UPI00345A5111
MIGTPYHAMLEYVHEVRTNESFALVTIKPSSSEIVSRVQISFTSHQIVFDGREHMMKELKGKFVVSDDQGEKVEVLPSDFSFDAAEQRVVELLADLNQPE